MDAGTVEVLKKHLSRQAEERLLAGPGWRSSDDYVFTTGWGGPIHPDTVSSLIADLIEAHNATAQGHGAEEVLPRAGLHDLRHVHAMTLQGRGVASDATFGRSREHALPAAQRGALPRPSACRSAVRPG
jgi:integrase